MNPLAENAVEKTAYQAGEGHREYRWGKGLGQFGANNAAAYGLDWSATQPTRDVAYSADYNQPNAQGVYPIWSPRGSILALAKHLKEILDRPLWIDKRDANGNVIPDGRVNVKPSFTSTWAESSRFLAGSYNRGLMPENSIREYYRQTLKLPKNYGQIWNTPRIKVGSTSSSISGLEVGPTPSDSILFKECVNLCHVWRIAGLCGSESQGLFSEYSGDFNEAVRNGTRSWTKA
jgi:hypothetical protein